MRRVWYVATNMIAEPMRLKLPPDAADPELTKYLVAVDAATPAQMQPDDGAQAIASGLVELDGDARFLPLMVSEDFSFGFIVVVVVLALLAGGATMAGLMFVIENGELAVFAGLGVGAAVGGGVFTAHMKIVSATTKGTARHTGILMLPDALVIRRRKHVDIMRRDAIETIEERMWQRSGGGRNEPPWTHYQGLVIVRTPTGRAEVPIVEHAVKGEADLSLRASHPEGRYVGELVKHLVRKWLRADQQAARTR